MACLSVNAYDVHPQQAISAEPSNAARRFNNRGAPSWRDEYNVTRLQRSSSAVQSGNTGQTCDNSAVLQLFDVLEDLVNEQEDFRKTIEGKLDELDQLDQLIGGLEQGFNESTVTLQQLASKVSNLEANVGTIVL